MLKEDNLEMLLFHTRYLKQKDYWTRKLSGQVETTDILETDAARPRVNKEHCEIPFNDKLSGRILNTCKFSELALYIFLLSTLKTLVHRYTGKKDIMILAPILEGKATGDTINSLVLIRQYVDGTMTFKELVLNLRNPVLEAYENQDYPYEKLEEYLFPSSSASNISCVLENIHSETDIEKIKTGLSFGFSTREKNIRGYILYDPNVYRKIEIHRLADHFVLLLTRVSENINIRISDIEFLTEEEKKYLLNDLNNNKVDFSNDKTLPRRFEEQVKKSPDAVAITCNHHQVTYIKLNQKANRLANHIRIYNLQQDRVVSILLQRSLQMVESILAVWKAGGAYIPLDIDAPVQRLQGILADSAATVLLSQTQWVVPQLQKNYKGNILLLDEQQKESQRDKENIIDLNLDIAQGSLAYVIYTSGSTGKPKGAMVQHIGMMNHIHAKIDDLQLTAKSIVAQNAAHTFDISVWQFFVALTKGGKTIVYPNRLVFEPGRFISRVIEDQVSILEVVPSYLSVMLEFLNANFRHFDSLKYLLVTGETINPRLVNQWFDKYPAVKMVNAYGPTEASDDITHFIIDKALDMKRVPIGKPVRNLNIYILDEYMNLCPPGIKGEICVSGIGVGRGYLNNPELTAEKFKRHRSYRTNKTYILYKTGDLGCWLPDGSIEFFGRKDYQVKIHGFRIEPGEIENRLAKHPGIKEVVVIERTEETEETEKTEDKYLCSYIVSDRENIISELREYLSMELPDYMIPSYFVQLEKLPLTPNGKVDRKALPKPELTSGQNYVAPRNRTEGKLVGLWADVLNIQPDALSIDSNFFELGGHSLKATVLASRIHKELNVKIPLAELFKTPTIRGLSEYIKRMAVDIYESIMPVEEKEYYELSFAQKRMYILQQIDLNSTAYNMPEIIPLAEEVDIERLEESFKKLIKRHDSLRTSFHMIGDQPVQKIHQEVPFKIERPGTRDQGAEVGRGVRPFDLSHAPLLCVGLLKSEAGKHLIIVDMHHIISDGVSHEVLVKDFLALYDGRELPPLRIQYKDFAQWQNSSKEVERIHQQMEYWLKEFAGEIPVLELPTDYPRPLMQSFEGNSLDFEISAEETRKLNALALRGGASLFMVLAAAVNILLSKLSGQEEIIIGTPIAGRRHSDLEKIIGIFVNTLALRNYPTGEQTFTGFLGDVKERVLMVFENQDYPFEGLVDKLLLNRDMGRNPLFDVMFALQNMNTESTNVNEETRFEIHRSVQIDLPREYENIDQTAKFDLTFTAMEIERKTLFSIQYCTKLFKQETIERFINYFKKIVSIVVKESNIRLSDIEIISEKEKKQILFDFNNTAAGYPKDRTIHRLFEEQVERTPDRIAVIGSTAVETLRATSLQMTYRQLNLQSDRLAGLLIEKGVLPDNIVAIMMEPSVEMIIGIMGILKSGGAYLPIDPDYPKERIDFMLKDSGAQIMVGNRHVSAMENHLSFHHSSFIIHHSSHLAYIIYTSGSTGKPKGVLVEHGSVVNLIYNQDKYFNINQADRILQFSSICFDASVEQIFIAFSSGAVLVLIDKNTLLDIEKFDKFASCQQITHIHAVPSFLTNIHLKNTSQLKRVIAGGDICPLSLAEKWNTGFNFYNEYGPTETTVTSIEILIKDTNSFLVRLPIGKPIDNTIIYLLDRWMKPVPLEVVGELYIGGAGVARGYLNQPELTSEKFKRAVISHSSLVISSPSNLSTNDRLYKTGDICKWLPDGNIEFLGRQDFQVKIRGFRIELGEIENRLLKYPGIKEAFLSAREEEGGDKSLYAYIVSDREYEVVGMREFLSKELPSYMIPAYFVKLEKIPLTPNGKVDRKALPKPGLNVGESYTAPRNEIEKQLVGLWAEILGRDPLHASQLQTSIGIDDNFFQLGGHSLKATVLTSRIHKELNVIVPLAEIFKTPTIKDLGDYIRNTCSTIHRDIDRNLVLIKDGLPGDNHLFFIHDGTGAVEGYVEFCKHLTTNFNCWGIRADRLENQAPRNVTIEALAETYIGSMKKIQPHGPYYIAGWSLGGTIAFEMTAQLEKTGDEIAFLALIDSPPPHKNSWKKAFEFNLESELNLGRTLLNARARYKPTGKIHTQVHYVAAGESREIPKERWNDYCHESIIFSEIAGDHFSIFKMPATAGFAKLFDNILVGV